MRSDPTPAPSRAGHALRRLALGLTAVALAATGLGLADADDPADAQSRLGLRLVRTHDRVLSEFQPGAGTSEAFSTAAVGDVTGDGSPEVVTGSMDGRLRVHSADGGQRLDVDTGDGAIQASPALVDLDGDGVRDIVLATVSRTNPRVLAYTGSGQLLFSATDAPRSTSYPRGFFGTPAVGDLDGDGQFEIVAAGFDHNVHAWNLDGSRLPGFPRFVYDTVWSSPVLADIDGNGSLEIVVGGDMDAYPGAPLPAGGVLWALRADGSNLPGYPVSLPGQTIWSTPAVADLDADGDMDIVVGTGLNWPGSGKQVYALDGPSGRHLPGWPAAVPGRVMGSPALGDLTGDGRNEVAVATEGGWVVALTAGGGTAWRTCNRSNRQSCDTDAATHGQVSLADLDGDGRQEVVAATEHWLRIFDGRDRTLLAEQAMPGVWAPAAAPTIADIGGRAHIVLNTLVADGPPGRGAGDRHVVWTWTTDRALGAADWPTFKRDAARSGTTQAPTDVPEGCPPWGAGGIQRLYLGYFEREPDADGLAYWMGQRARGVHLGTISSAFVRSEEFRRTYGNLDDAQFIDLVYRNLFDRSPDRGGFDYWLGKMRGGELGHAGVMVNFTESREFKGLTGRCP